MECKKTGCHIYIEQYSCYAYGDAFEGRGVALFRIVHTEFEPISSTLHYKVGDVGQWFDRERDGAISTLVTASFHNLGYEGVSLIDGTSKKVEPPAEDNLTEADRYAERVRTQYWREQEATDNNRYD